MQGTRKRALILQCKEFSVHTANQDWNATNLNPLDRTFRKLFAEKRRVPVVDKAPIGILVRLVKTLCARIIGPLVADAVDPVFAPAMTPAIIVWWSTPRKPRRCD